jgi:hypothetical protein
MSACPDSDPYIVRIYEALFDEEGRARPTLLIPSPKTEIERKQLFRFMEFWRKETECGDHCKYEFRSSGETTGE